eukprot:876770_1
MQISIKIGLCLRGVDPLFTYHVARYTIPMCNLLLRNRIVSIPFELAASHRQCMALDPLTAPSLPSINTSYGLSSPVAHEWCICVQILSTDALFRTLNCCARARNSLHLKRILNR